MTRDRAAVLIGTVAGITGVAAGLTAIAWGARLGTLAGGKQDPVPLGLLTVLLSSVAVAASVGLSRTHAAARARKRAAVAAGQSLPGLLGFTTVGRLWWIPGSLLLLASIITISVAPMEVVRTVRRRWPAVLTGALGACMILVSATASAPLLAGAGVSGVLVATAPWLAARPRWPAPVMLAAGTLPFAAFTWWTLITPLIAVLTLTAGFTALRQTRRGPPLMEQETR